MTDLPATPYAPAWGYRPSIGLVLTVEGPQQRLVFWVHWRYGVWVPIDSPLR